MILITCPGCRLKLNSEKTGFSQDYDASLACLDVLYQLTAFTLSPGEPDFIHQIVVDTYRAQHHAPNDKPVSITFALIGLYLVFEKGYTGRQVQLAHMTLAKRNREWPNFKNPRKKNAVTVQDVLEEPGTDNHRVTIMRWAEAVWADWEPEHEAIRKLVETYLFV